MSDTNDTAVQTRSESPESRATNGGGAKVAKKVERDRALDNVDEARSQARRSVVNARRAIESSKDAISEGVAATQKKTVRKAQDLTERVTTKAGEVGRSIVDAERRAEAAVNRFGTRTRDQIQEVADKGAKQVTRTRAQVRRHPLTSVVAGASAGLLAGWTLHALRNRRKRSAEDQPQDDS